MAETDIPGSSLVEGLISGAATGGAAGLASPAVQISNPLDAVTKIWNTLSSRSFLIRVAEGLIGGLLIIISVDHMSGINKVAATAAKVIP
jgi:hypothetical protein